MSYKIQELIDENNEQREEIRLLSEQVNVANQELLRRAGEIEKLTGERDRQGRAAVDLFDEIQRMKITAANKSKEITRLRGALRIAWSHISKDQTIESGDRQAIEQALLQEPA